MTTPYNSAFAVLVAEHGYALRSQAANGPSQYVEQVTRTHRHGDVVVDAVTFWCSTDRGDVDRGATLIGLGENRRFTVEGLLHALGLDPSGTDEDFVTAARQLDTATVERLAPA